MAVQPPPQMTVVRPPTNGQAIASLVLGWVGIGIIIVAAAILIPVAVYTDALN